MIPKQNKQRLLLCPKDFQASLILAGQIRPYPNGATFDDPLAKTDKPKKHTVDLFEHNLVKC